jgi:hypothetical protein
MGNFEHAKAFPLPSLVLVPALRLYPTSGMVQPRTLTAPNTTNATRAIVLESKLAVSAAAIPPETAHGDIVSLHDHGSTRINASSLLLHLVIDYLHPLYVR